jgi:hypothetical protein
MKQFFLKHKVDIAVIFAYLILTAALTYPVALGLNEAVPIAGGDVFQVAAKINDQAYILQQNGFLKGLGEIYLQQKTSMNTFAGIFVWLGLPLKATYNSFLLLSFFLSAIGTFYLAKYFTKNSAASFVAGLIFAFAPFHVYQAMTGHSGTMHQQWLPFFVLFFWKWFDLKKLSDGIWALVFLVLIAITEHHLLAFTSLFIGLFMLYQLLIAQQRKAIVKSLAVATGALIVVILVFYVPYLKVAVSEENYLDPGANQVARYSMALLDPFITPPWHSIWSSARVAQINFIEQYTPFKLRNIGEGGSSAYFGYSVIGLLVFAAYSAIRKFKRDKFKEFATRNKVALFWAVVVLVFAVSSLGPSVAIGSYDMPTPYGLVYKYLPFFKNIRTVGRFFVYSLLGISVLVAICLNWLAGKMQKRNFIIGIVIFGAIVILEFAQVPFGRTSLAYSAFYDQLAKEEGDFALLEVPGSTHYDYGSFLRYTNTIHHKKSLSGIVTGRKLPNQYEFQKNTPVINDLLYNLPKNDETQEKDVISQDYVNLAKEILNYYDVRYVTVNKGYFKKYSRYQTEIDYIKNSITNKEYYKDPTLDVFEIPQVKPEGMFVAMVDDSKWGKLTKDKELNENFRNIRTDSQLLLVNMNENKKQAALSFKIKTADWQIVEFLNENGEILTKASGGETWENQNIPLLLKSGENLITLKVTDKDGKVISSDKKNSAVAITHIAIN